MEVGEGQLSNVAKGLFTDGTRVGGVWMPLLLDLVDPSAMLGKQCGGMGAPGHVAVTIEPGGTGTMTTFCGFMVPQ